VSEENVVVRITSSLGKILREQYPPDEAQRRLAVVLHMSRDIGRLAAGAPRARAVHTVIDQMRRSTPKDVAEKVTCRKGCSHCCHIFATCTDDEALLLAEVIERDKVEVDLEMLRIQNGLTQDGYEALPYDQARCALLGKDGVCQVYADRPSSCRNWNVSTPAERCDSRSPMAGNIQAEVVPMAEFLASAAMNLDERAGEPGVGERSSIATKLWRHLGHGSERRDIEQTSSSTQGPA